MRPFQISDLLSSSIGFDQLLAYGKREEHFPPYDIISTKDDSYTVRLAVAGFSSKEIEIEVSKDVLLIVGKKAKDSLPVTYIRRGLAERDFKREFRLAPHVEVVGASLKDGLLEVNLAKVTPEEMRPKRVEISVA